MARSELRCGLFQAEEDRAALEQLEDQPLEHEHPARRRKRSSRRARTPRSQEPRLGWILVLALVVVAIWLLW